MPQASAMRPTSIASAGNATVSSVGSITASSSGCCLGCCGSSLLHQTHDGRRSLRTHALPVSEAVRRDADAFFVFLGGRVVETQTLDETAIAADALVRHDDVEERTAF